jgi:hypothetical protein
MVMVVGPNADPFAVYDPETCECVLAEWYKCAIRAIFPEGSEPTHVFWLVLTDMVSKYRILQKCHANRQPPAKEIKRWQKMLKLAAAEGKENITLTRVNDIAEAQLSSYRIVRSDFSRKKNRNNEILYNWILGELWCDGLGQALGVSVNENVPSGPLVRFFSTCVNPLLAKPLTTNAIVTIRNRVRGQREKLRKAGEIRAQKTKAP